MMNELWKMTAHQVKEAHFTKAIISIGPAEASRTAYRRGLRYPGSL